jgi:amidase
VTLDHLGPIGRNVEEVAKLLEVISGPDSLDPRQRVPPPPSCSSISPIRWDFTSKLDGNLQGIRIGVLKQGFNIPDISLPETDETVTRAIHK